MSFQSKMYASTIRRPSLWGPRSIRLGSILHLARAKKVRELIAKRIIEAAKNGERDPICLRSQALFGFSIDDVSMPVVSVGRTAPSPAYAAVAHAA